ncbi:metal-dependent hydrolase [Candidatus Aminicenantes bacterium AC-335-A11]|nr:metal-dependent hydrolase [Candidatus Aminicenantes bacterium AC-335-A11]
MPSPLGHSLASLSIGLVAENEYYNIKYIFFILLLGLLPDMDLLPTLFMGLEKGGKFHQIYTHNFLFALIVSLLVYLIYKNKKYAILSFIIICTHFLIDSLVTDYREPIGVPMFYPFWNKTFYLGLFPGISKGNLSELFSISNLKAIGIELIIFLPIFLLLPL